MKTALARARFSDLTIATEDVSTLHQMVSDIAKSVGANFIVVVDKPGSNERLYVFWQTDPFNEDEQGGQ